MSNLDWFWSSKRQNNCSHISRWTLTGLKQLSFTWFSINHVLVSNLIIRIFWGALLSLFLSGGMIFWGAFIIHLSISIALYVRIIYISSYWDIIRDIEWYLDYFVSVSAALLERSQWLTSQSAEFHHNISICSKLYSFFPLYSHSIKLYEP